jgi:hypothetical protein
MTTGDSNSIGPVQECTPSLEAMFYGRWSGLRN